MSSPAPETTATTTGTKKSSKPAPVHPVTNFSSMKDADLVMLAMNIVKGMTGNSNFPSPPVDLTTFNSAVTTYSDATQAALDGGSKAIALRDKQRRLVINDLKLIATYVDNNSNNDAAILTTSGFQAKTPVKTAGQPVGVPTIRNLDYGNNTGQLTVSINKASGARAYFVRYSPLTNGAPGSWTSVTAATLNKRILISGLTPGTVYGFQVQALGAEGYSDWSTLEQIMCV